MSSSSRRTKRGRVVIAALAVVALPLIAAPAANAATTTGCGAVSVPMTVAGQTGQIAGTLCTPPHARTLQILIHGFTYNRGYWDSPFEPDTYSYVRRAVNAGYATLAIDQLGAGASWHPASAQVTLDNDAAAVHQVVQAARHGAFGTAFNRIALVGHSYGSLTSYVEAGDYRDVDAIVATGAEHQIDQTAAGVLISSLGQATLDPKFTGSGLDSGYVTTSAAGHDVFLNLDDTDPAILPVNENTLRDVGTTEEVDTLAEAVVPSAQSVDRDLDIPVLTINGQQDPFFCVAGSCASDSALAAAERPFYGPNATVVGHVVPGTGHDLNLELSAPQTYGAINDFMREFLPG